MTRRPELRFAFRLAAHLRQPDPYAMLATMPAWLFNEWFEFSLLEPFGAEVDDHRFGMIAAQIANFAGKQLAPWAAARQPSDFFPSRIPAPEEDLVEKLKRLLGAPPRPDAGEG